ATVHLRPGGPGLDAVAGGNQAGTAEQPGLPRCAAGGRRLGADRAGTQSAAKAQESPPASVNDQPALGVAVRGRAAWAAAWLRILAPNPPASPGAGPPGRMPAHPDSRAPAQPGAAKCLLRRPSWRCPP